MSYANDELYSANMQLVKATEEIMRLRNKNVMLQGEVEECQQWIKKQGDLLTDIANVVRGTPPYRLIHSHHGLVDAVTLLKRHRDNLINKLAMISMEKEP